MDADALAVLRIFHIRFVRCSDSELNEAEHWQGGALPRTADGAAASSGGSSGAPSYRRDEWTRRFNCGCGHKCYLPPSEVVKAIGYHDQGLRDRVCVRGDTANVVAILKHYGIWTTPFAMEQRTTVGKIREELIGKGLIDYSSPWWRDPVTLKPLHATVRKGSIVGYRWRRAIDPQVQQLVAQSIQHAAGRTPPWAAAAAAAPAATAAAAAAASTAAATAARSRRGRTDLSPRSRGCRPTPPPSTRRGR